MGRKPVTVNKKSAERITILLKFLGLSQEQFADKIGYSRQSITSFNQRSRRKNKPVLSVYSNRMASGIR